MIRHSFFDLIREESDTNFKNRFDISSRNFTQYSDRFWLIRSTVWRAWFQPSMNPLEEQSYTNIYTHTYTLSNINPSSSAFRPFFQSDVKTFHAPTAIQIRPRFEETNGARPFVRGRASNITKHRQKKYLEEEEEERFISCLERDTSFLFFRLPSSPILVRKLETHRRKFEFVRDIQGVKTERETKWKKKRDEDFETGSNVYEAILANYLAFQGILLFFLLPPPYTLLTELPIHLLLSRVISCVPPRIVNELSRSRARWGRKEKETGSREIISGH